MRGRSTPLDLCRNAFIRASRSRRAQIAFLLQMERQYASNILLQKFWLRSKDLDYTVQMGLLPVAVMQTAFLFCFVFLSIAVKSLFSGNHSGKKAQFPHIFFIRYWMVVNVRRLSWDFLRVLTCKVKTLRYYRLM